MPSFSGCHHPRKEGPKKTHHRTLPAFGKINTIIVSLKRLYLKLTFKVKHWGLSNLPLLHTQWYS